MPKYRVRVGYGTNIPLANHQEICGSRWAVSDAGFQQSKFVAEETRLVMSTRLVDSR